MVYWGAQNTNKPTHPFFVVPSLSVVLRPEKLTLGHIERSKHGEPEENTRYKQTYPPLFFQEPGGVTKTK